MNKKIIFSIMMLLLVVVLVSCGNKNYVEDIQINNNTGQLVFEENEKPEVGKTILLNVKYYEIMTTGAPVEKEISQAPIKIEADENNANILKLTYSFTTKRGKTEVVFTPTYNIYIKNGSENTEPVMTVLDIKDAKFVYALGQSFTGEGIKVINIFADGTKAEVAVDEVIGGHEAIVDKDFFTGSAKGLVNGFEFNYAVRGGEKPIHSQTAKWHNWVFLQMFVAYLMSFIGSITGQSLALSILITTIIVRTLAWPIYAKSNDLSMKMSVAQPDIQRLQNKYATRKDPESQQRMQMEMMQIYKKHKINFLGCLMPFLQMPIFIAMYNAVRRLPLEGGQFTDSVSNTMFLGFDIAAIEVNWINYLLAAIVGVTMYILQKISTKKPSYAKNTGTQVKTAQAEQSEKTMKMVSYFMIIMMVMASLASRSIAFYWIIGNIYSLGQTMLNRYLNEKKYAKMKQKDILGI